MRLFLTADARLSKYDIEVNHHKESNSIPNTMLDRVITQILWVKNPSNSSLPLYWAIAAHSRTLFVDREVWKKFCITVRGMYNEDTIGDLSLLVYRAQLEEILTGTDDPDMIDEAFVLSHVSRLKGDLEKERDILASDLEAEKNMAAEYLHKLKLLEDEKTSMKEELSQTKDEKAATAEDLLQVEKRLKKDAAKKANRRLTSLFLLIGCFVILGLIYVWLKWEKWYSFGVSFCSLLGFAGVGIRWDRIRGGLSPLVEEKIYAGLRSKYLDD